MAKNADIAHNWAAQNKQSQQTGNGNFSFDKERLYSYAAEIGYLHPSGVALLTTHNYSPTTSQHQGDAHSAANGRYPILRLPLKTPSGWTADAVETAMLEFIEEQAGSMRRARKPAYKEMYYGHIVSMADKVKIAAKVFPECLFANVIRTVNEVKDNPDFSPEIFERLRAEREKAEHEKLMQRLHKWLIGESNSAPHSLNETFLRLTTEGIETSKGVMLDVDETKRIFDFWKARQGKPSFTTETTSANGQKWTVEIHPSHVRSGCHLIKEPEIKRFAALMGW